MLSLFYKHRGDEFLSSSLDFSNFSLLCAPNEIRNSPFYFALLESLRARRNFVLIVSTATPRTVERFYVKAIYKKEKKVRGEVRSTNCSSVTL